MNRLQRVAFVLAVAREVRRLRRRMGLCESVSWPASWVDGYRGHGESTVRVAAFYVANRLLIKQKGTESL